MALENLREVVAGSVKVMLVPILRLCVRHSIKLSDVIELVKIAFVQVGKEEVLRTGSSASVSRVSATTGVHRKDVTRIEKEEGIFKGPDNLISRIMVQWQHDKRFTTKAGKPRALIAEGRWSEFAQLVEAVNGGDLGSYAVLFEMERMGVIERAGKRVKLLWRDFVPGEGVEDGLMMLAEDTSDLISAVEENLFERPHTPNLHLKTEFDGIVADALPRVRDWLLNEGSAFHRRVRKYLSRFDTHLNPSLRGKDGVVRVAFGSFSVVNEAAPTHRERIETLEESA